MTKEMLESYKSMEAEIKELKVKIENLAEAETDNSVIFDYKTGFPRPQSVVGVDEKRYYSKLARYQNKIKELQEACDKIEAFVEDIPDSLTRRIFRLTYIEGNSMETVGKKVGLDKSNVSRKIDRYLKENLKLASNTTKATV